MPKYYSVAEETKPFVDEYLWLSARNNIHFSHKVMVGFGNINREDVVGTCTYGEGFREVEIDTNYWNYSTNITKMTLIFHELTHAYCLRSHDYGLNLGYPKIASEGKAIVKNKVKTKEPKPGYLADGCPMSIMHPYIVSDDCMLTHYERYTSEMFERCQPY